MRRVQGGKEKAHYNVYQDRVKETVDQTVDRISTVSVTSIKRLCPDYVLIDGHAE